MAAADRTQIVAARAQTAAAVKWLGRTPTTHASRLKTRGLPRPR